jgi:hypothetical protein
VPFLRVTRDQRGYENTFLLHVKHPGDPPRVLYWYRSAPGVRVGRHALDEDAIRTIEEQHPDIEFDWPQILEAGTMMAPEVERRPERPRRRLARPPEQPVPEPPVPEPPVDNISSSRELASGDESEPKVPTTLESIPEVAAEGHDLLSELVGREIASRLRARYADVRARLERIPDATRRPEWQTRVDALNPDAWATPEEILRGVQRADGLFDELRREMKLD